MRDCDLKLNEDGLYQCTRKGCRWVYPLQSNKPPRRNCDASEGLGDTIAKVIKKTLDIRPCGGCGKRRRFLNRLVPYRNR